MNMKQIIEWENMETNAKNSFETHWYSLHDVMPTEYELQGLEVFTLYRIRLMGVNSKGNGSIAEVICRSGPGG